MILDIEFDLLLKQARALSFMLRRVAGMSVCLVRHFLLKWHLVGAAASSSLNVNIGKIVSQITSSSNVTFTIVKQNII